MSGLEKSLALLVWSDGSEVLTVSALLPGEKPSQEGPEIAGCLARQRVEQGEGGQCLANLERPLESASWNTYMSLTRFWEIKLPAVICDTGIIPISSYN